MTETANAIAHRLVQLAKFADENDLSREEIVSISYVASEGSGKVHVMPEAFDRIAKAKHPVTIESHHSVSGSHHETFQIPVAYGTILVTCIRSM